VEGLLGEGSTARVFQVDRNRQSFALKVALPGADERVEAEGVALDRARGERIVRLEKKVVIKGRTCLLLGLAGETLGDHLAKHGPPSLARPPLGEDSWRLGPSRGAGGPPPRRKACQLRFTL
jgi:hypothetical protein